MGNSLARISHPAGREQSQSNTVHLNKVLNVLTQNGLQRYNIHYKENSKTEADAQWKNNENLRLSDTCY